jgi:hypothetical protein
VASSSRCWAELLGQKILWAGPAQGCEKKKGNGSNLWWFGPGRNTRVGMKRKIGKLLFLEFSFWFKAFEFKSNSFKYFQTKFWAEFKIEKNQISFWELFKSVNLEFDLNIQIQPRALNERTKNKLKQVLKIQNKFWIFLSNLAFGIWDFWIKMILKFNSKFKSLRF